MADGKTDKFASLMKLCKPTPSQESKLRICPLARESETFADSNADPVSSSSTATTSSEPTGIVMVSLPDSNSSIEQNTGDDDELEFHTPPEQCFTSSEDQIVDCADRDPTAVDLGCTGGGAWTDGPSKGTSGSRLVELKKNRVPDRGLSQNSSEKKARVSEDSDSELKGENEFVEKVDTIVVEILFDSESEKFPEKTEKANMAVDSPTKKSIAEKDEEPKHGESNEGDKNGDVPKDGLDEIAAEINKNCKPGENKISESDAVKIYKGEKAHENGVGEGRLVRAKNAGEIQTAAVDGRKGEERVGGGSVSVSGKRELPPSIKGKEKNVGREEVVGKWNARTKTGLFMELLEVLNVEKAVVGDADSTYEEDVDFLELAKRQGFTFPKPRWWPANGFQE